MPRRRVVLSYGAFDLLTPAHAHTLSALSKLGSEVIIGCASDAFCRAQGFVTRMCFEDRRALLEKCRFVDRVIAQVSLDQMRTDIVNYNVSVIAMGAQHQGQLDNLRDVTQVHYLPQSSSPLRAGKALDLVG